MDRSQRPLTWQRSIQIRLTHILAMMPIFNTESNGRTENSMTSAHLPGAGVVPRSGSIRPVGLLAAPKFRSDWSRWSPLSDTRSTWLSDFGAEEVVHDPTLV